MKKTLIALFATASLFTGVSAAQAEDLHSKGELTVRATLKEGCTINFGNGNESVIDFGNISALSGPMTRQSSFTLGCSQLKDQKNVYTAASVSLDGGNVTDSTVNKRKLGFGSNVLDFQVYQQATGETVWGDGSAGAPKYDTPVANGVSTKFDYHVTLLPQELNNKPAGTYQNTMIATVNYTSKDPSQD